MVSTTALLDFEAIYVINLPHREDRRREVEEQLQTCGMSLQSPNVHLFPAVRPETAAPFASIGAKGCFMSHLGVLRQAMESGHNRILILEDDADFTDPFRNPTPDIVADVQADTWDLIYFGHRIHGDVGATQDMQLVTLAPETGISTSHAIAIRGQAIADAAAYLELLASRPAGHPEGGPMHVDGAYSWFRKTHSQLVTLVSSTEWVIQRASQTDIFEHTWKEKLPFINLLRRLKNKLRS